MLYKSVEASSFSDDIPTHVARWMAGQTVDSKKLVRNAISEVYSVKDGFDDAKWDAVATRWSTMAPALLEAWNTIDTVAVTTVKGSFQDRFVIWSTRMSEGPSMDDLFTPISDSKWDAYREDVAIAAMVERSQDSAESDSDFVLLKCIGALCGQDQLANIHVGKAVAMFKSKAAAVCSKIATTRRQPPLLPLTQDKLDSIAQYDVLVKYFHNVSLQAADVVSGLELQQHNWMQAPHLN